VGYQGSALPLSYGSKPAEIFDSFTDQTRNIIAYEDFCEEYDRDGVQTPGLSLLVDRVPAPWPARAPII
jgi:hypothetical protein